MIYLAVNKDGTEVASNHEFRRDLTSKCWYALKFYDNKYYSAHIYLPKGTIKKLTGKDLTWLDEYIELTEI